MRQFSGIVSDSLVRFRRSREYGAVRTRLLAEARVRHDTDFRAASFWGRLLIRGAIEREVRSELNRIHPPGALYFGRPTR
jgi:hypothetical protein